MDPRVELERMLADGPPEFSPWVGDPARDFRNPEAKLAEWNARVVALSALVGKPPRQRSWWRSLVTVLVAAAVTYIVLAIAFEVVARASSTAAVACSDQGFRQDAKVAVRDSQRAMQVGYESSTPNYLSAARWYLEAYRKTLYGAVPCELLLRNARGFMLKEYAAWHRSFLRAQDGDWVRAGRFASDGAFWGELANRSLGAKEAVVW